MDRRIRQEVGELLKKRDFSSLLARVRNNGLYWREVQYRLYDVDETVCWPAIEMAGHMMRSLWQAGEEEKVRKYIRVLFWSLNDESGGIGWNHPQTIAEIVMNIPQIADPYAKMMIAHTIEEPPLVKGCLWGLGRLGSLAREPMLLFREEFGVVFRNEDPEIIGTASWAAGQAGFKEILPVLPNFFTSSSIVKIYQNGIFVEKTVGRWAKEAASLLHEAAG
jgi:hypothetical protein